MKKINTIIFPIIYKIGREVSFDRNELLIIFKEVKDSINKHKTLYSKLGEINLDVEVFIVNWYSKGKINELKSNL
jgi:hypothetical protein